MSTITATSQVEQIESGQAELYDGVASDYEHAYTIPLVKPLMSLFDRLLSQHAIQLQGGQVLELACGTGFWLRRLRDSVMPARLVGVDISDAMIEVAKKIDGIASISPGLVPCQFLVADCSVSVRALANDVGKYDMVMANFLFNYAKTEEEMSAMWRTVSTYLKPGGVFIGATQSFKPCPRSMQHGQYGEKVEVLEQNNVRVRQKLTFKGSTGDQREFESYMITDKTIWERTAKHAGIEGLTFQVPRIEDVPSELQMEKVTVNNASSFWNDLMEDPWHQVMTARKRDLPN